MTRVSRRSRPQHRRGGRLRPRRREPRAEGAGEPRPPPARPPMRTARGSATTTQAQPATPGTMPRSDQVQRPSLTGLRLAAHETNATRGSFLTKVHRDRFHTRRRTPRKAAHPCASPAAPVSKEGQDCRSQAAGRRSAPPSVICRLPHGCTQSAGLLRLRGIGSMKAARVLAEEREVRRLESADPRDESSRLARKGDSLHESQVVSTAPGYATRPSENGTRGGLGSCGNGARRGTVNSSACPQSGRRRAERGAHEPGARRLPRALARATAWTTTTPSGASGRASGGAAAPTCSASRATPRRARSSASSRVATRSAVICCAGRPAARS